MMGIGNIGTSEFHAYAAMMSNIRKDLQTISYAGMTQQPQVTDSATKVNTQEYNTSEITQNIDATGTMVAAAFLDHWADVIYDINRNYGGIQVGKVSQMNIGKGPLSTPHFKASLEYMKHR